MSVAEVWWWLFMWGDGVRGLAEARARLQAGLAFGRLDLGVTVKKEFGMWQADGTDVFVIHLLRVLNSKAS